MEVLEQKPLGMLRNMAVWAGGKRSSLRMSSFRAHFLPHEHDLPLKESGIGESALPQEPGFSGRAGRGRPQKLSFFGSTKC